MPPQSLENRDFEDETLDPWVSTNAQQTTVRSYNGTKSITRITAGNFAVEQDVSALGLRFDQLLFISFYAYSLTATESNPAAVTVTVTFTDDTTYVNTLSTSTSDSWIFFQDVKPGLNLADKAKIVKKIKLEAEPEVENVDYTSCEYAYLASTAILVDKGTITQTDPRGGNISAAQESEDIVAFAQTAPLPIDYGGAAELYPVFEAGVYDHNQQLLPGYSIHDSSDLYLVFDTGEIVDNVQLSGYSHTGSELYDTLGGFYMLDVLTISGRLLESENQDRLGLYNIAMYVSKTLGESFVTTTNALGEYTASFNLVDDFYSFLNTMSIFAYNTDEFMAGIDQKEIISVYAPEGVVLAATVNLTVDLYKLERAYTTKGYLVVKDEHTGLPINNLLIIISNGEEEYKRISDIHGRARLNIPSGTYSYEVSDKDKRYEVKAGSVTTEGDTIYLKRRVTRSRY